MPILPLDAAHRAVDHRPSRDSNRSMVVAVAGAAYFFTNENQFGGVFLMLFAFTNFTSTNKRSRATSRPCPTPQLAIESPPGPAD